MTETMFIDAMISNKIESLFQETLYSKNRMISLKYHLQFNSKHHQIKMKAITKKYVDQEERTKEYHRIDMVIIQSAQNSWTG